MGGLGRHVCRSNLKAKTPGTSIASSSSRAAVCFTRTSSTTATTAECTPSAQLTRLRPPSPTRTTSLISRPVIASGSRRTTRATDSSCRSLGSRLTQIEKRRTEWRRKHEVETLNLHGTCRVVRNPAGAVQEGRGDADREAQRRSRRRRRRLEASIPVRHPCFRAHADSMRVSRRPSGFSGVDGYAWAGRRRGHARLNALGRYGGNVSMDALFEQYGIVPATDPDCDDVG